MPSRPAPGTQMHLGKRVAPYLARLDRVIEKRGITRSRAVNILVAYVLRNNMLSDILDRAGATEVKESLASIAPTQPEILGSFFSPSGNLFKSDDVQPEQPHVSSLPEPSRVATSAPMPELRPHYYTTRGNFTPRRYVEKTKNELREELRQAVENTR